MSYLSFLCDVCSNCDYKFDGASQSQVPSHLMRLIFNQSNWLIWTNYKYKNNWDTHNLFCRRPYFLFLFTNNQMKQISVFYKMSLIFYSTFFSLWQFKNCWSHSKESSTKLGCLWLWLVLTRLEDEWVKFKLRFVGFSY